MAHSYSTRNFKRRLFFVSMALICLALGTGAFAQSYTSIVIFGDSLSDTGNDTTVSSTTPTAGVPVPAPATGYTNGRFTDGNDTIPTAQLYSGVWIEQVAAQLTAHPVVKNSLAGGTNYAYGFATTNTGTSVFTYGPNNVLSFSVNNMGQQVAGYLATNPTINNKTLFVVWGGANDLINATSSSDITNAAARDAGIIQTLINAGATDFVVPNLPPLGLVPRFNGSMTASAQATAAALGYNQALGVAMQQLGLANTGKNIKIYALDVATLFNAIVATPSNYGFANVTASSQGNAAVDPDTYLFWDDLHPTTAGHHLIAASALRLLGLVVTTMTTLTSSNPYSNLSAPVTFTATVANASGGTDTPVGNVTFQDGNTTIGTGFLTGSGVKATATFTTSTLAAVNHPITASYSSVNGFGASASYPLNQSVIAPSYSVGFSPSLTVDIPRGGSGSVTLNILASGGYTGSFSLACGALPAHFGCTIQSPTLAITSATPANGVNTQISFQTTVAAVDQAPLHGREMNYIAVACGGLPLLSIFAFFSKRKWSSIALASLFAVLCTGSILGLSGCSSANPYADDTPGGIYYIPIIVTPTAGAATTPQVQVVVQ